MRGSKSKEGKSLQRLRNQSHLRTEAILPRYLIAETSLLKIYSLVSELDQDSREDRRIEKEYSPGWVQPLADHTHQLHPKHPHVKPKNRSFRIFPPPLTS